MSTPNSSTATIPPVARERVGVAPGLMRACRRRSHDAAARRLAVSRARPSRLARGVAQSARRRRPARAGLLASAWLYPLPLIVLVPAELRYLGWTLPAASLIAAHVHRVQFARRIHADRLVPSFPRKYPMSTSALFLLRSTTCRRPAANRTSFRSMADRPKVFASLLQEALRTPSLWQRWRSMQPDPDAIDPALGARTIRPRSSRRNSGPAYGRSGRARRCRT